MSILEKIKNAFDLSGHFHFELNSKRESLNFKLDSFIGQGADAKVFNVSEINNIKISQKDRKLVAKIIITKYEKNKLQRKLLNLNHENIEKLLKLYETPEHSILICEKLDDIVKDLRFEKLSQILYLSSQIIEALIYLHTKCPTLKFI